MSIEKRVEAAAKNIAGKIQAGVGEATGDPKAKAEGQAKQDEAAFMHAVEDVKDTGKNLIDKV